jgi:hypothetical protein
MTMRNLPSVKCPAGEAVEKDGLIGVQCKIERRFLSFRENPRSVAGYCSTDYTLCPVWIAEKENDPAVDAAHGIPRLTNCHECEGSGIVKVERLQSGLWFRDEAPCDLCVGTGKVAMGAE